MTNNDYAKGRADVSQWQPIETAPTNVDVLLYCPHLCASNPERMEVGPYRREHNGGGSIHSWATHWMPLPEPPKAGA